MRDLGPGEFWLDLCRVSVTPPFVHLFCPDLASHPLGSQRLRRFRSGGVLLTACLISLDCLVADGVAGRCLFLSSDARLRRFNAEVTRSEESVCPEFLRVLVNRLHSEGFIRWRRGNNFHDGKGPFASSFTVTERFRDTAEAFFAERGETLEEGLSRILGKPYTPKRPPVTFGSEFKEEPPRKEWRWMVPLVVNLRKRLTSSKVVLRISECDWGSPAFPEASAWLNAGGAMPTIKVRGEAEPAFPSARLSLGGFVRGRHCLALGLSRLFVTAPFTGDKVADITHLFADLHRVFTERMDETGRFYSSASPLPRILRRFVFVDGEAVVDLDLKACHPTLLYHTELRRLAPADLYEAPASLLRFNCDAEAKRRAVKLAVNILINASSRRKAERALAFKLLKPHDDDGFALHIAIRRELSLAEGQPMTDKDALGVAVGVIRAVEQGVSDLKPFFYSGVGNRLQRVESSVLESVLPECLARGMWVQPFHDGLLVLESDARDAMAVLSEGYREVIGFPTIVTAKVYSGDDGLVKELEGHSMRLQSGEATLVPQVSMPQGILENRTSSRSATSFFVL